MRQQPTAVRSVYSPGKCFRELWCFGVQHFKHVAGARVANVVISQYVLCKGAWLQTVAPQHVIIVIIVMLGWNAFYLRVL